MGHNEHWLVRECIESADTAGTIQIKRDAFTAAELNVIREGLAAHGFSSVVVGITTDPGVEFWESDT